jgi:hypothetical protein
LSCGIRRLGLSLVSTRWLGFVARCRRRY